MFIEQLEDRKNDIYVFVKEILDEFKKQKTNSDWVKNQTDILVKPERIKKLEKYLEVQITFSFIFFISINFIKLFPGP